MIMKAENLTKREYIATQIAIGLSVQAIAGRHNTPENMSKEVPYASVMIADALIKELEKTSIENETQQLRKHAIVGNTLLAAVAHQRIDLIKEYLEPTGVTIEELMDRDALASLCQLLDAYLLEAVRNRH